MRLPLPPSMRTAVQAPALAVVSEPVIVIPDHLPRLAKGAHRTGTGRMCTMNALSYLRGDREITDHPANVHPVLASHLICLNDQICDLSHWVGPDGVMTIDAYHGFLEGILCVDCATIMWGYAARAIGTWPSNLSMAQAQELVRSHGSVTLMSVAQATAWRREAADMLLGALGRGAPRALTADQYEKAAVLSGAGRYV